MKRGRVWWAGLTSAERVTLYWYEHSGSGSQSALLPDDCWECPSCSTPSMWPGLCPACSADHRRLIERANSRAREARVMGTEGP